MTDINADHIWNPVKLSTGLKIYHCKLCGSTKITKWKPRKDLLMKGLTCMELQINLVHDS